MAGNDSFVMVTETGWRRGLGNLLRGEINSWFGRIRWFTNSLIWVGLVNAILGIVILQTRNEISFDDLETVTLYTVFGGMFVGVGVIIAMQGAIVGEKNNGTAAWVMSKPVSRQAYLLAKIVGNGLGLLFTAILVPAIIAYVEISFLAIGEPLPVLDFFSGVAVLALNALFWMTFTLMLGTFFSSWGPVIAIPLALLFGQQFIIGAIPQLIYYLPFALFFTLEGEFNSISASLILGEQPFSWLPVISTAIATVLFLVIGIWRFQREEL